MASAAASSTAGFHMVRGSLFLFYFIYLRGRREELGRDAELCLESRTARWRSESG